MKFCALIPCFNEENNISNVVEGIRLYTKDVIVVDDGSVDDTGNAAEKSGATVIRHIENKGKGESLKTGFRYIEEKNIWDAMIILDGDGQHDWNEIPGFIEKAEKGKADVVVGDRIGRKRPKDMPLIRWLTNKVTSCITSKIIGQYVPDTQCGYKLIKTEVLKNLKLRTSRYDIESEILIQSSRQGYKIASVPVKSIYRDEKSYISPGRDTVRFIKLVYDAVFGNKK